MQTERESHGRIIFHVDANSFFASCEIARDPSLQKKPVVVAGDPKERKGIVLAASYVAKQQFGIYTTMPLWEAKKRCPSLVVRPPDFPLYREMSRRLFQWLERFSPVLERASIDEGYLDVTGRMPTVHPLALARHIQQELLERLSIPVSIGIAPNKFLAKMASDRKKPLGITVLRKRDIPSVLWPLPVEQMHGVGDKTAKKLHALGLHTIGDLAKADRERLRQTFGIYGSRLYERANGIDPRPVDPTAAEKRKSIGHSTTLPYDIEEEQKLLAVLRQLAESVGARMNEKRVASRTVQLTIRYHDFHTITRSQTGIEPLSDGEEIFSYAARLFQKHWDGRPVRLLGVAALHVFDRARAVKQLDLFHYEEEAKMEPLWKAVEQLRAKFGARALQMGVELLSSDRQTKEGEER
ncbi:DNA polymerase IV [Geobacillus subterraneus]|uniref:DNA polymerase IV n=1 Tax=Geobacillus subterraneus TaxID=129338 RepID=UPI001442C571|nr:DNA polymerase IV [Geobacillus subterraneus]QIZ67762.1 DNA polymerase IV [Geobacillus subterraneus]WPZ19972.1 DNA polymerase IV [Geobacillus subterraneus]